MTKCMVPLKRTKPSLAAYGRTERDASTLLLHGLRPQMRRWCTLPAMTASWLPGVHPSAKIQGDPDLYEIENRAADPEGRIEQTMWQLAPWQDQVVLDLGARTGFHCARSTRAWPWRSTTASITAGTERLLIGTDACHRSGT
jgi:hypothetical protein